MQTASNPYISIIGPIESAAKRISIMDVCNKVAGMLSPIILGTLVLKKIGAIESQLVEARDVATTNSILDAMAWACFASFCMWVQ